jgi:uncharacterized protein (DUF697 family)
MWRLTFRIIAMAAAVLAGHALGGLIGVLVGVCIGTVIVTQTEDVVRIARRSSELGGSGLRVSWRALRAFFGHTFVRRLARAFTIALFSSIVTFIAHKLGGEIGAVVAAAAAVALGQTVVPSFHAGQQVIQADADHQHHV